MLSGKILCDYSSHTEYYQKSSIKELASFANGLNKDIYAIENAVASKFSNGFVEGTNSKIKMIKRTMYGRCSKNYSKQN